MAYQTNTNHYESTLYIVDDSGNSPYTTIQSAIDAANTAGTDATVFIRAGAYTENLTLYDGITLKGYTNLETVLTGVHTPPTSGSIKISDMGMASATDIMSSAAAGTAGIYFENCEFNCTNGFICNLANWTGDIDIYLCEDKSTACGVVNNSASATVSIENCVVGVGSGNTFTVNGPLYLDNATIGCPISLSGSSVSTVNSGCIFKDTFTISSSADLSIVNSHFSTGANTAFSTTSSVTAVLTNVGINSSNVAAIGGTGTVEFVSVSYEDTGDNAAGVVEDLTGTFRAGIIISEELQLGTALAVTQGGTGATTLTDNGLLYGNGTSAVEALAEATDGQIPIGSTGNPPTLATLTEGTNIDVTNGAGSITTETTKVEINAQTGTTYTLVLGDRGKLITLSNAAAITLTVPPNSSVAFATGTVITLCQIGAGTVTVAEGTGVTVNSLDGNLDLSGQYAGAALHKVGTDSWLLIGSLV